MHTFACNLYQSPVRLFVHGNAEISSTEGTTQGGPESMAIYALATIPRTSATLRKITDLRNFLHQYYAPLRTSLTLLKFVTELRNTPCAAE